LRYNETSFVGESYTYALHFSVLELVTISGGATMNFLLIIGVSLAFLVAIFTAGYDSKPGAKK
jgi:hypothetical protein